MPLKKVLPNRRFSKLATVMRNDSVESRSPSPDERLSSPNTWKDSFNVKHGDGIESLRGDQNCWHRSSKTGGGRIQYRSMAELPYFGCSGLPSNRLHCTHLFTIFVTICLPRGIQYSFSNSCRVRLFYKCPNFPWNSLTNNSVIRPSLGRINEYFESHEMLACSRRLPIHRTFLLVNLGFKLMIFLLLGISQPCSRWWISLLKAPRLAMRMTQTLESLTVNSLVFWGFSERALWTNLNPYAITRKRCWQRDYFSMKALTGPSVVSWTAPTQWTSGLLSLIDGNSVGKGGQVS